MGDRDKKYFAGLWRILYMSAALTGRSFFTIPSAVIDFMALPIALVLCPILALAWGVVRPIEIMLGKRG